MQYTRCCEVLDASAPECQQLQEDILQTKDSLGGYGHLPIALLLQGVVSVVAGLIGVWAVFFQSRGAARVFTLSWPFKFALAVVATIWLQSVGGNDGVEQRANLLVWFATIFFFLYYTKVSWSYYKKMVDRENERSSLTISGGSASPDTVIHEERLAVV